ncbi:MAG TPA: transposase [Candidatus Solibacter sp.]|nr:transposase [Candidatus Solibacter sp.]
MTFYRRNLPHWHPEGKSIFITWRLYRSLPVSVLRKLVAIRNRSAPDSSNADPQDSPGKQFLEFDRALDAAKSGPVWLLDPEFAEYAEYPILRGAELGRCELHAYAIMPNHVHVLLDPHVPLAKISGVIKGVAARDINARLGRSGKPLWQDESFDHWVRNSAEFERIRHYIEWNPVRAHLVPQPEQWKWSSAGNPYFKRLAASTAPPTIH